MGKKNKIENLIKEDLVNYNSSSRGYDWHNTTNPVQVSIVDILKVDLTNKDKASKVLPHEAQTSFEKILNIADSSDELKSDFIRAYKNPIIADDISKKLAIKEIVKDLNEVNKKYAEIVKKLEKLKV